MYHFLSRFYQTSCLNLICRGAAGRLKGLDDQLKGLKSQQDDLNAQWNAEKDQMRSLQGIKEEIDRVNLEIQSAERDYDLNRAAELKYGTLLELQKKLNETETRLETKVIHSFIHPSIYSRLTI